MEVQHVNVKIFAQEPVAIDLAAAIPVFHRWIQQRATAGLLIDVADYRHVPGGPGVMLIGHEAHYSLGETGGRFGLLYNRRTAADGSTRQKLREAYDAAWAACRRLEDEPEFRSKLKFHPGDVEVVFNDRCLTPNTDDTWESLRPELEGFFTELWGAGAFDIQRTGEPRERLRVRAAVRSPGSRPC
jgi:hypothetical protein